MPKIFRSVSFTEEHESFLKGMVKEDDELDFSKANRRALKYYIANIGLPEARQFETLEEFQKRLQKEHNLRDKE